ncbi:hypothetical protein [Magnetospirillum aberrantis]|uniref:Uncharacterized protein n=1 Tax=Magnetospirillum aberrantis SpK TaxID=908842 RepID=A0A7C9QTX0_9PROT|nr:hypothetical protein [Magnetospirillum aberrantis]NFV79979.1 hypothetical protein [Magnetospirillum aberrantis SpK]
MELPPEKPGDVRLEVDPNVTPRWAEVINLADVRVQFGRPRYPGGRVCDHRSMFYNVEDRRVWCRDCEKTIDGFDAFLVLVKHFAAMERAARHKLDQAAAAEKAHLGRRAAKELDHAWSGRQMAVACPHCRGGLLPEDFTERGISATSREIELARRNRGDKNDSTR